MQKNKLISFFSLARAGILHPEIGYFNLRQFTEIGHRPPAQYWSSEAILANNSPSALIVIQPFVCATYFSHFYFQLRSLFKEVILDTLEMYHPQKQIQGTSYSSMLLPLSRHPCTYKEDVPHSMLIDDLRRANSFTRLEAYPDNL